jgi:hypothetical protein
VATLNESDWNALISNLSLVLGNEAAAYADRMVARLLASVSYIAGADDPDRYALSNLLVLHAATKARSVYDHRPTDDADIYHRLSIFFFGPMADPRRVRYGLNLLALTMVMDHENDATADAAAGKYNPVNASVWNADSLKASIKAELAADSVSAALFDPIMPVDSVLGWWMHL